MSVNPIASISATRLAEIVNNRQQLNVWNAANQAAFNVNTTNPDQKLIENIRETAAMIVGEKPISAYTAEDREALILYTRTLDSLELGEGFLNGVTDTIEHKIHAILQALEPADMNLQRSNERVQTAINKPANIITATNNAATTILRNPEILSNAIHNAADLSKRTIAKNMVSENPNLTLGAAIGAATIEISDPLKKLKKIEEAVDAIEEVSGTTKNWDAYANLLGEGTVPPALKAMRDFSDWMHFEISDITDKSWVVYNIDASRKNGIESDLRYGVLKLTIYARDHHDEFGHGSETFLSMAKKYADNHQYIRQINADWTGISTLSTNQNQFVSALTGSTSAEQAAKQTFTGKMAERLALTKVSIADNEFKPTFTHPDWGAGPLMNDYSLAFSKAHGRPQLEVMPRQLNNSGAPLSQIDQNLMQTIYGLPIAQRKTVLDQMQKNLENNEITLINAISYSLLNNEL